MYIKKTTFYDLKIYGLSVNNKFLSLFENEGHDFENLLTMLFEDNWMHISLKMFFSKLSTPSKGNGKD